MAFFFAIRPFLPSGVMENEVKTIIGLFGDQESLNSFHINELDGVVLFYK